MNQSIIHKYWEGKATEEEKQSLLEWLHASPSNQAEFFELQALWKANSHLSTTATHLQDSLKEVNLQIDLLPEGKKKKAFRSLYIRYSVAAVVTLLMAISIFYFGKSGQTEKDIPLLTCSNPANDNSIRKIFLPDSTVVWLGNRTSIRYASEFRQKERVVYLNGKAFFEVKRDTLHPFIVKTDIQQVKVLGTAFSIDTRVENETCETILMSGSVRLNHSDGKSITILYPGQQALYSHATHSVKINEVDANALTSWRFGLVSLTQATIEEIIQCLESTYSIQIKMDTRTLLKRRYNFSFKASDSAAKALEQLALITGVKVTVAK